MKDKENKDNKEKETKKSKPRSRAWVWPVKVLLLAIFLSFGFSMLSELTLTKANIVVAVIVILVFICIAILFDMLGLAVASCELEPFNAMASRKVKGSKQAIALVKNADKVSSIFADVIGDVCGILSGSAGATIVAKILLTANGNFMAILVPSLVSAVIAALTIFGKASLKKYAITHCTGITLKLSKFLNFFTHKDRK